MNDNFEMSDDAINRLIKETAAKANKEPLKGSAEYEAFKQAIAEKELPKAEIFKLVHMPYEKSVTVNNKDYSISVIVPSSPNLLKQFKGRLIFFCKARTKLDAKGKLINFSIVKDIPNKSW